LPLPARQAARRRPSLSTRRRQARWQLLAEVAPRDAVPGQQLHLADAL